MEKAGLKLNIQKTKIMASGPITSWQIKREKVETVTYLFSWAPESQIKRCLLFVRKAMTNLDIVLKSRDSTLLTKVCIVKITVFLVVMNGFESWTIKKAEH